MDKVPKNRKKEGIFLTERSRMDRVLEKMAQRGLEQLVISDPVSIWYLTGVKVNPIERLFALYLRRDGRHKLFKYANAFFLSRNPNIMIIFSMCNDIFPRRFYRLNSIGMIIFGYEMQ